MPLTNEQWSLVRPLLEPSSGPRKPSRGRPALDRRLLLDGILWKLATRLPWRQLPLLFGSYQACYQYYNRWFTSGVLAQVLGILIRDVQVRGGFDFPSAHKSGEVWLRTLRGGLLEVYLLPALAFSWQCQVALVVYQYWAARTEHRDPRYPCPPHPLDALFPRPKQGENDILA